MVTYIFNTMQLLSFAAQSENKQFLFSKECNLSDCIKNVYKILDKEKKA